MRPDGDRGRLLVGTSGVRTGLSMRPKQCAPICRTLVLLAPRRVARFSFAFFLKALMSHCDNTRAPPSTVRESTACPLSSYFLCDIYYIFSLARLHPSFCDSTSMEQSLLSGSRSISPACNPSRATSMVFFPVHEHAHPWVTLQKTNAQEA